MENFAKGPYELRGGQEPAAKEAGGPMGGVTKTRQKRGAKRGERRQGEYEH